MLRHDDTHYAQRLNGELEQECFDTLQRMLATEFMELMSGFYEGIQVIAFERALSMVAERHGLSAVDLAAITESVSGKDASTRGGESPGN